MAWLAKTPAAGLCALRRLGAGVFVWGKHKPAKALISKNYCNYALHAKWRVLGFYSSIINHETNNFRDGLFCEGRRKVNPNSKGDPMYKHILKRPGTLALAVLLAAGLVMSGCAKKKDAAAATPFYTNGDGIPELTAIPSNVPASATKGTTININADVDSDTGSVLIQLWDASGNPTNSMGYKPVTGGTAQTVSVPVAINSAATPGNYTVMIDTYDKSGAGYTAYVPTSSTYTKYTGCKTNGCPEGTPTSLTNPVITITVN